MGETIIESLEKLKKRFDYAVFIFHPDDEISFRSTTMKSVRDNVIFEFGLFVGVLGIKNCFAVIPNNIAIKQPSDLLGVIYAKYNYHDSDSRIDDTIRTPATEIKRAIKERQENKRNEEKNILERGEFRDSVVDASVDVEINDYELYDQWINSIKRGEKVREDLLYWERKTAKKWLEYEEFTDKSFNLISKAGSEIKNRFNKSFDLISLGPGSGNKDIAFLTNAMNRNDFYWYYPIDISSHLLFVTLKNVTNEFNDAYLKVKGIRANFDSLEKLKFVYKYTNELNIFMLLGNTLGNYSETRLVNRIKRSMFNDDIFILEINNIEGFDDAISHKYKNKNYQEFIVESLKSLGITPNLSNLRFEETGSKYESEIPNSKRVFANYYFNDKEMKLLRISSSKLTITYSTHYDKDEVKNFLEEKGFTYVKDFSDKHSIVLIAKK